MADVRDRRCRADRCGACRADRRALPSSLRANFRRFDPASARIVLLDAVDTVLPSYPPRLRRRARRDLEELGVDLRLGTRVVGVDAAGLDVDGGRIEARTKIWAAGVQASSLGRLLADRAQATVDRAGRVEVAPDCSLPGHPEVFVVGDLMALDGLPGGGGGRPAERAPRGPDDHAAAPWAGAPTISLPQPGHHGDDLAVPRRGRHRTDPDRRPRRMVAVAPRPPRLHHRVQEPGRGGGRLGSGVPRRAAGASGPSPSSRCSPGRVPSRRQRPLGDLPRAKRMRACTSASPRRRQPADAATGAGRAGVTWASRSRSAWKIASENVGNGWMTSSSTGRGVRARTARVTCWSHSPASGPRA